MREFSMKNRRSFTFMKITFNHSKIWLWYQNNNIFAFQ